MTVYVAMLIDKNSSEILGVFSSREKAVDCCLKQPSFTRQSWRYDDSNSWCNGHGLYVKIVEFNVT